MQIQNKILLRSDFSYKPERAVGIIQNKDTFLTQKEPKHFFRKYCGFGLSVSVLQELLENNIHNILIQYNGKRGRVFYLTTIKKFIESPKRYTYKGIDEQVFVSVYDMKILKNETQSEGIVYD
jgi:hypothetical protein